MSKLRSLAFGGAVALGIIGLAHAGDAVTGDWKLTVGVNDAPCTLTLAQDTSTETAGTVAESGDCSNHGTVIGHWKTSGSSLQLLSGNGTLVAWLKPKGDTYVGKMVQDDKVVALAH